MAEREWTTVMDNSRIGEAARSRTDASDDFADEEVWNIIPGPIRATELYLGVNVVLTVKPYLSTLVDKSVLRRDPWMVEGKIWDIGSKWVVLTRPRRDENEKRWTEVFKIPIHYFDRGLVRLERAWE